MIAGYLDELTAALRGPRGARADLLAEARDGLVDVADAYRLHGMEPDAADRRAVEEFGTVDELAPRYQAELGLSQGRRTAWSIVLVLLAQPVLWSAVTTGTPDSPGYAVVDRTTSWVGGLTIAVGLLLALGCGLGQRYVGPPDRLTRLAGGFGLTVVVVFTGIGGLYAAFGGTLLSDLPLLAGFLLLPLAWIAYASRRCLTLSA